MKRKLYTSTGTIVGRANGFDIHLVSRILPQLIDAGLTDGAELMMLPVYYDRLSAVAAEWRSEGIPTPILHCEKEVGTKLSDAAALSAAGDASDAARLLNEALELFRPNCEMCALSGANSMVLHLWGGRASDRNIDYNAEILPQLLTILRPYGVQLLIENVPSVRYDPLSNWQRLLPLSENVGLIFDTRFGQLHRQISETWADSRIRAQIRHIHISDIRGEARDFSTLRPILHPGEGMIDFGAFAQLLHQNSYSGTVTLESPVIMDGGADGEKLAATLRQLRAWV